MKLCNYYSILFVILVNVKLLMIVSATTQEIHKPGITTLSTSKPHRAVPKVLRPQDLLSVTHYLKTCPQAESIIQSKVKAWVQKDFTLAPSIIRLHFHDCVIRVSTIPLAHAQSLALNGTFFEILVENVPKSSLKSVYNLCIAVQRVKFCCVIFVPPICSKDITKLSLLSICLLTIDDT